MSSKLEEIKERFWKKIDPKPTDNELILNTFIDVALTAALEEVCGELVPVKAIGEDDLANGWNMARAEIIEKLEEMFGV